MSDAIFDTYRRKCNRGTGPERFSFSARLYFFDTVCHSLIKFVYEAGDKVGSQFPENLLYSFRVFPHTTVLR